MHCNLDDEFSVACTKLSILTGICVHPRDFALCVVCAFIVHCDGARTVKLSDGKEKAVR